MQPNQSMPARLEIKCINKSNRQNEHERIQNVGGGPGAWKHTQEQAIQFVESGFYSYYVNQGGRAVDVIISRSRYGFKYLKTAADGEGQNNLLNLPECR